MITDILQKSESQEKKAMRLLSGMRSIVFPLAMLIATGLLLGIAIVLCAAASKTGIPPATISFWQALIGGSIIVIVGLSRGVRPGLTGHHLRYYAVTGLCSVGLPNTLLFLSISHVGAGHVAISYAITPMLTYFLALTLRIEPPRVVRLLGLALGATGAILLTSPRFGGLPPEQYGWMALVLLTPLTVASANIYRSLDWPKAAPPDMLAGGMLIAAALWIAPAMLISGDAHLPAISDWPLYAAGVVSAAGFAMSFALQRLAGPVTFSQLGYVVIAVTAGLGALFFDERFSVGTSVALAIVLLGMALTTGNWAGTRIGSRRTAGSRRTPDAQPGN